VSGNVLRPNLFSAGVVGIWKKCLSDKDGVMTDINNIPIQLDSTSLFRIYYYSIKDSAEMMITDASEIVPENLYEIREEKHSISSKKRGRSCSKKSKNKRSASKKKNIDDDDFDSDATDLESNATSSDETDSLTSKKGKKKKGAASEIRNEFLKSFALKIGGKVLAFSVFTLGSLLWTYYGTKGSSATPGATPVPDPTKVKTA